MIFNELKHHGKEDFPLELYNVDKMHPKYEMAFHWHTNLEFVRILKGTLSLTLDNRTYLLSEGDAAIINSETLHGATPINCMYQCIVFDLSFFKTGNSECDEFIESLLSRSIVLRERPTDPQVLFLIGRIFETLTENAVGTLFKTIGYIHELLGEIQQKEEFIAHLPPSSLQDKKKIFMLKTALNFIREHYAEDITLEDIAQNAGLSSKYFCRFFKDMTATTPINYLIAYRIERAARRLLNSDDSITQIAYNCGFNDVSYFIKTFKQIHGISPTKYQNSRN